MRPIGFSSGALAKGDFHRGIELQQSFEGINAIELSALRESELAPLVAASRGLALGRFEYVSFHAPSAFRALTEESTVELLASLPGSWPIVVHPDLVEDADVWARLGSRPCLENMDLRKSTGRTVPEMKEVFSLLPESGFCLDLGHARQIDPTMGVAIEMLRTFGDRLRQLHVSEVGTFGEHRRMGFLSRTAFARVARYVPADIPLILESIVSADEMQAELDAARLVFAA
jgi:hypothetical protein